MWVSCYERRVNCVCCGTFRRNDVLVCISGLGFVIRHFGNAKVRCAAKIFVMSVALSFGGGG